MQSSKILHAIPNSRVLRWKPPSVKVFLVYWNRREKSYKSKTNCVFLLLFLYCFCFVLVVFSCFFFFFFCFYLTFYISQYSIYAGFNKDLQLHNFSSVEMSIRLKVLQRSWSDRKGYRVMIRPKGVQSHDQTERGTESWSDRKGHRVMIRRKGVQSHDQMERGTESWSDRKGYRVHDQTERVAEVMIRRKGLQSHD